jgi:hypothetical protein
MCQQSVLRCETRRAPSHASPASAPRPPPRFRHPRLPPAIPFYPCRQQLARRTGGFPSRVTCKTRDERRLNGANDGDGRHGRSSKRCGHNAEDRTIPPPPRVNITASSSTPPSKPPSPTPKPTPTPTESNTNRSSSRPARNSNKTRSSVVGRDGAPAPTWPGGVRRGGRTRLGVSRPPGQGRN